MRVTQDAYFLLLTHTKQLLLMTFCDTTAGIGKNESVTDVEKDTQANRQPDGQTDIEVEIAG